MASLARQRSNALDEAADAVEALPDYDSNRNGFSDLIDKHTAAEAIRSLKRSTPGEREPPSLDVHGEGGINFQSRKG